MHKHFLISRTDAIGDVILSLPVAAALKEKYPGCKITWIGKTYTEPILKAAVHVDHFMNYDQWLTLNEKQQINELKALNADVIIHIYPQKKLAVAAKKSNIPIRIGTSHRIFHWLTCNKLVPLGRKNSLLHESQLNLRLCAPLGITVKPLSAFTLNDVALQPTVSLPDSLSSLPDKNKIRVVLHPCSQGSAREWGTASFLQLIHLLPADKFQIFVSGTKEEGEKLTAFFEEAGNKIINITGKLTLDQLLRFYTMCSGIVAASTGPLHICSALGKNAIGIYPPIRPMHPGRWAPIGPKATFLVAEKNCNDCRKNPASCVCMQLVLPATVAQKILQWE